MTDTINEGDGKASDGREVAHFQILNQFHEKLSYMEYSVNSSQEMQFS